MMFNNVWSFCFQLGILCLKREGFSIVRCTWIHIYKLLLKLLFHFYQTIYIFREKKAWWSILQKYLGLPQWIISFQIFRAPRACLQSWVGCPSLCKGRTAWAPEIQVFMASTLLLGGGHSLDSAGFPGWTRLLNKFLGNFSPFILF